MMHDVFSASDFLGLAAILAAAILAYWGNRLPVVITVIAVTLSAAAIMLAWVGASSAAAAGFVRAGHFVAMAGGILAMLPALVLRARPVSTTSTGVEILFPSDRQTVPREFVAIGKRASLDQRVQVFVSDGATWWPQERVVYEGLSWRAKCWFGRPSDYQGTFDAVAVADLGYTPDKLVSLPADVLKSAPVRVTREPRPTSP